jgi:hypothetical protein
MKHIALLFIAFTISTHCACATERLSPPLSVEGARAALAQAGVREGVMFNLGPYRYRVVRAAPTKRSANEFALDIRLESLPLAGQ